MNRHPFILPAGILTLFALLFLGGCNSKSDPFEGEDYISGTEVPVTRFSLKANSKIMPRLDSVFFSIDLDNGLIYNADSLPVGTRINGLVPLITYPSSVASAIISIDDEETGDHKEIDYKEHPSDTVDFTKKVTLTLTSVNADVKKTYLLKVNVHSMDPDSLWWDETARAELPSRLPSPQEQKTVSRDGKVWSLIRESDGSFTLSSASALNKGDWTRRAVSLPFTPDVRTLTATPSAFYILSDSGELFSSADGSTWTTAGQRWLGINGAYGDAVVGVRTASDGQMVHTRYPLDSFAEYGIEEGFPIRLSSAMGTYATKWSSAPLGLITGGETASGSYTGECWAFDGARWVAISNTPVVPSCGGTMIPYYAYLKSSLLWLFNEYSVWIYMGGRCADGSLNRTVYITYDNGVNWIVAPENMQMPDYIPPMWQCDHAVIDTPLDASFAPEIWKSARRTLGKPRKLNFTVDGYNISWNCPYIYLVGGRDVDGVLCNSIWKGVINRMSFKPLI